MRGRLSALWVRNLIGAMVVAVAIGVIITTILGDQWATYRHTVVPATVVAKGQTGSAGDQTWKVDSVKHLNRNPLRFGPELPAGTVLTVVTVDRSGPLKDEVCYGVITDGERRWKAENIGGFSAASSRRSHQPVQPTGTTSIHVPIAPGCGSHRNGHHRLQRLHHGALAVVVCSVRTCSRQ